MFEPRYFLSHEKNFFYNFIFKLMYRIAILCVLWFISKKIIQKNKNNFSLTFFRTNESFYVYLFNSRVTKGWESYAYTWKRSRPEILEARKRFICFECRWQSKLPGTLPDVSLPLTVIGGYSDSNGIPTSTSDPSPPFYVHTCTVTPEVPSLQLLHLLLLLLLRVDSSSDKLDEKKKKEREVLFYWELISIIGQEFFHDFLHRTRILFLWNNFNIKRYWLLTITFFLKIIL